MVGTVLRPQLRYNPGTMCSAMTCIVMRKGGFMNTSKLQSNQEEFLKSISHQLRTRPLKL
ncbi:MAG: hypothetical protein EFT35_05590 [Methanophagales archaeon ANME-1-THS]|nr:MAG: hypothetical protein EFT35_05590 [Methanophagales archaeon ANME-1-THS]